MTQAPVTPIAGRASGRLTVMTGSRLAASLFETKTKRGRENSMQTLSQAGQSIPRFTRRKFAVGQATFTGLKSSRRPNGTAFYEELYQFMRDAPVVGLACVIDRPGYNHRYRERYANERWSLCKTAFNIAVERAAKYAHGLNYRLRVSPERCNKPEDAVIRAYYDNLVKEGMPFAKDNSEKYGPLTEAQFREILYEFKPKFKSSPMVQLADLYLWPLCMGGYHASNRTYERLKQDKKLIDCLLNADDCVTLGIKYSCFDLVERKP
jgi:hypothetical protein